MEPSSNINRSLHADISHQGRTDLCRDCTPLNRAEVNVTSVGFGNMRSRRGCATEGSWQCASAYITEIIGTGNGPRELRRNILFSEMDGAIGENDWQSNTMTCRKSTATRATGRRAFWRASKHSDLESALKTGAMPITSAMPRCWIGAGQDQCARLCRSHASMGCGGFQRSSPIGGAANGMPLNEAKRIRAVSVRANSLWYNRGS